MDAATKQEGGKRRKPLAAIVPGGIRRDPNLSPRQKIICGVVHLHGGDTTLSNGELADVLNVCKETIRRNLKALENAGHLERKGNGKARRIILSDQYTGDIQGRVYLSRALLQHDGLTHAQVFLLARLYGLSINQGCTAKAETLAYEQGVTRQTIENRITQLREAGFIITVRRDSCRSIHTTQKTEQLFLSDPGKNCEQPPTKTNTPLQSLSKGEKQPITTNKRDREPPPSTNQKSWQKRAIRYAERLCVNWHGDGYWFVQFRDHDEETLSRALDKTQQQVDQGGEIENPKGYFIRTLQNIEAGNDTPHRNSWQRKAVKTADDLDVEADAGWFATFRDHTPGNLRTAYQETVKRKGGVENLKAYFIGVLDKIDAGKLDDFTTVSPQAEQKALAKHRNLTGNQDVQEPDEYMAYLYEKNPSVADQAYGKAYDVVQNGKASSPLKLFTYYAKRIMSSGDEDTEREPDSTHDEGPGTEELHRSDQDEETITGRYTPGVEKSRKQLDENRREREKIAQHDKCREKIRERFKRLDESEKREVLDAAREELPSFLSRNIGDPPVDFDEVGPAKYTITGILEEKFL
jgi:DNA-binding MarR family transcriptional regulator